LYNYLHAKYKGFEKHYYTSQHKIDGMEGKIRGLHFCILELEAQIGDLKALDDEGKWKLAK
jgi:hypothetical protein